MSYTWGAPGGDAVEKEGQDAKASLLLGTGTCRETRTGLDLLNPSVLRQPQHFPSYAPVSHFGSKEPA